MARPATKADLIEAANAQFERLDSMIGSMTAAEQNVTFDFGAALPGKEAHWQRDRNQRDVLIHLYEWHRLLLNWVSANRDGEEKPFLPSPYNWKNYGQMNVSFWERHQATPLERAKALLQESYAAVMAVIEGFSDDELFGKKHFSWTGTTSLGSYCVSATSSHYDWAMKKIKRHIQSQRA